jgi:hypothetical protein
LGEQDIGTKFGLPFVGVLTGAVDRGVDQARDDGVDSDARHGKVAGHRKRQTDDARLGRAVGGLPQLAVERRDRRRRHDHASTAVTDGLLCAHRACGNPDAVEGADEID